MQRHLRLRRKEDFARVRQHGRVWRHRVVILSVVPNGMTHNRYGFITSKHLGNAVVRNRTRRRLREIVRRLHPYVETGHDVVFIARQPLANQSFQAIVDAVQILFQQAGLYQSPPPGETHL